MTIPIYLLGVCISAIVWFLGIKIRQSGYYLPMPRKYDGNLLDPLDKPELIDWTLLMLGWFIISVAWPFCWTVMILFYVVAWVVTICGWVWEKTLGNEKFAHKIFGIKGE